MRAFVSAAVGLVFMAQPAFAWVEGKGFMSGGGVGNLSCPEFLNAMATARQAGGIERLPGANQINPFAQYVAGFQTAYNLGIEGMYDIFSEFGDNHLYKVLYALEPWCADRPTENVNGALFALINKVIEARKP